MKKKDTEWNLLYVKFENKNERKDLKYLQSIATSYIDIMEH